MRKPVYKLNGQVITRKKFLSLADAFTPGVPMTANTYRGHDPLISEGLGCMKAQVPKMRRMIKDEGIQGVLVRDSGQLEITSRRGRKKLIRTLSEIRGERLCDADGGYGD